ncbi:hypothetical protein INT44_002865 [Umbelopsis vinacea]|uniref:CCHC-type domain-containing protein n=1 Tax=Umbelopsis vinacea TaxID=44442 RepID=A0A8H7Q6E1_9FUNG|nr:hypothetical protein INT44_002865 [Umbelopsis vinacea]
MACSHPSKPQNVNGSYIVKPVNLSGGQCSWCGKYGHKRPTCPLLK